MSKKRSKTAGEVVAEIGRFHVVKVGETFSLHKDDVEILTMGKREILNQRKDWRGMSPEYTVASILLEIWLKREDNFVNTKV